MNRRIKIHNIIKSSVVVINNVLINWKIKIGKIALSIIQTNLFNQGGKR